MSHRIKAIAISLLLGATSLAAQNAAAAAGTAAMSSCQSDPKTGETHCTPISLLPSCPVTLRALHSVHGELTAARNGQSKGFGQSIHLIVSDRRSKEIEAATVTARGLNGRGRMTQTENGRDSSYATRTVQVRFAESDGKEVSADLWLPGMTVVRTLEVDSLTYADGSVWKVENPKVCRVSPEQFMRIDGR